jgi:asparagine synthase (glutamine-hydrolysing)
MQYIDCNFWLIGDILLKADKMAMAHSLESRVPFLDRKVFALSRTLPVDYRYHGTTAKYVLREAASRVLPTRVAQKAKLGFPVPMRVWLKEDAYYNRVKALFTGEDAQRFFNTGVLVALLDEHRAGREDNSRKVWALYVFLIWYGVFFGQGHADTSVAPSASNSPVIPDAAPPASGSPVSRSLYDDHA